MIQRSLSFKLMLVILLVSLSGVGLVALMAGQSASREFDRLLLEELRTSFGERAANYYRNTRSWRGVATRLSPERGRPSRELLRGSNVPNPVAAGLERTLFSLLDVNGCVVLPAGNLRTGTCLNIAELETVEPLDVDGVRVGWILTVNRLPTLDPLQEAFLERFRNALVLGAIGSLLLALVIGVLLTRTLTRPLTELRAAIGDMRQGRLGQSVPVRSLDELGELAGAFNEMSADLERASVVRKQMTADIAHELRNPLMVLSGTIEALRDGVLQPTDERFHMMFEEAEHLKHLVDDLRTLSLADSGQISLNREVVPIVDLLDRVADGYALEAHSRDVDIHVVSEPGLTAAIDPARIVQVLGNLVTNALRFTPAGGQINLTASRGANDLLLTVRDTGLGIPETDIPYLFDRFYRGNKSRKADAGESGLGLAIARSLVEAHGGGIEVASTVGEGTHFKIRLPLST